MSRSTPLHESDDVPLVMEGQHTADVAHHHERVSSATSFTLQLGDSPRKSVPYIHIDGAPPAAGLKATSAAGILGDRNVSSQWSCQLTNDSILTSAACTTTSGSFALPHQSSSMFFFQHSQPSIVFVPARDEDMEPHEIMGRGLGATAPDTRIASPPHAPLDAPAAPVGAGGAPPMQPSELTSSASLFLSHHNTTWSPMDTLSATARYVDGQTALGDWVPTPIASGVPTPATTPPHTSLMRVLESPANELSGTQRRRPPLGAGAGRGQQRDRASTMHAAPPSRRPPSPPGLQCSASAPFFPAPRMASHPHGKHGGSHPPTEHGDATEAAAARPPAVRLSEDASSVERQATPPRRHRDTMVTVVQPEDTLDRQQPPAAPLASATQPPVSTTNALWTDVLLYELPPTIDAVHNAIANYGKTLQRDVNARARGCAVVLEERSLLQSDRSPAVSRGCSPCVAPPHVGHNTHPNEGHARSVSPAANDVGLPGVACHPQQNHTIPSSTLPTTGPTHPRASPDALAQVTQAPQRPPQQPPVAPPKDSPCGQLYRAIAEVAHALSHATASTDAPATASCLSMPPLAAMPFRVSSGHTRPPQSLPPPPPPPYLSAIQAAAVAPQSMPPPPPPPFPPPILHPTADVQQLKYALGSLIVGVAWWLLHETTEGADVPARPPLDRHSDRDEQRVYDLMTVAAWSPEDAACLKRMAHTLQCAGNALIMDGPGQPTMACGGTHQALAPPSKVLQPSERCIHEAVAQLGALLSRISMALEQLAPTRLSVQATHDLLARAMACLRQRASLRRKKTSMYDSLESGVGLVGDITAHLVVLDTLCDDNARMLLEVYDKLCRLSSAVSSPAPTSNSMPTHMVGLAPSTTIAQHLRCVATAWYRIHHKHVEASMSVFGRSTLVLAAFPEQQQTPPSIMFRLLLAVARASGIHAAPLHFVSQSHSYCGLWVPDNAVMAWTAIVRHAHAVAAYASAALLPYVSLLDAVRLCVFLPSVPLRHPAQLGAVQQPSSVGAFWQMHLSSRGSTANLVLLSNAIGHLVNAMPVYVENVGATRALNVWVPLAGRDAWMLWASQVQAFVDHSGELLALHHSPVSLRAATSVSVGLHAAAVPQHHQQVPQHVGSSSGSGGGFEEVVLARKKNRTRCGKDPAGGDVRRSTTAV